MKPLLNILFLCCLVPTAKAQTVDFYGKDVVKDICNQYGFEDKDAKACLDKICDAASIPNNFVLAPCTNIDNCFALYKNGYSYIVYDINFFNKVKSFGFTEKTLPKNKIDWAALTVLAHEIGHHMCLHTTNPNLASIYTPVQIELQADEYAGGVVYKLGATLAQAQQAMNSSEVPEDGGVTHPSRAARLAAIAKGWNKENAVYVTRNSPGTPQPETSNQPPVTGNQQPVTSNVEMPVDLENMVLVRGGAFTMGSGYDSPDNEKPEHTVTINSFYMSKYLVTQAQWQSVMGYNPSANKCDKCPVENISWDDAQAYCQEESNLIGKTCRLPTEAEWEYAARGGGSSNGYSYSGSNNIDEVAWYDGNSSDATHPVGQKQPNELGLYDMTGNVWEWCSDWYDANYYGNSPARYPKGPPTGSYRVVRGGSWNDEPQDCRAALRGNRAPASHSSIIGFRVVISP